MATLDNSIDTNFNALVQHLVNQASNVTTQFSDDLRDSYIRSGLFEMGQFAHPRYLKLNVEAALNFTSQSAALPSDYLYHDVSEIFTCTIGSDTNQLLEFTESRHLFANAANQYNDRNYYRVFNGNVVVNKATITACVFEYIREPALLTASSNTSDFTRQDMYDKLALYVVGKLFLSEGATDEQKARSTQFFEQFYNEIGARNPEALVLQQVSVDKQARRNARD